MQQSIMAQGLDLMLFGMGAVFVFLTLLVFFTRFMSWAVNRFFPEPEPVVAELVSQPATGAVNSAASPEPQVLAAIQSAIALHRSKQGS